MRILALIFALATNAASAQDILCRVVGVTDGDTLTCLTADQQQIKTRLARIDAPEKRQPYGERSRQSLAGMVFDRDVRLDVLTTDRYGRTVATVWRGKVDVNQAQIAAGLAWVYRAYPHTAEDVQAEEKARTQGAGLWAEAGAIPPWEWRKGRR